MKGRLKKLEFERTFKCFKGRLSVFWDVWVFKGHLNWNRAKKTTRNYSIFISVCSLPHCRSFFRNDKEILLSCVLLYSMCHFRLTYQQWPFPVGNLITCSSIECNKFRTARNAVSTVMIFIIFLLHIIVEVLHLLISYLAIQRCLLFLFDSFEKQLVAVQNKILSNIWYLYILFIAFDFINIMLDPMCAMNPCSERKIFQAKMFFLACFLLFCYC